MFERKKKMRKNDPILHLKDAERIEEIRIRMELDPKSCTQHSQAIKNLPMVIPLDKLEPNDYLKVNYTFYAYYFGNVVKALEAVKQICSDPEVVVSASCDDLTQGRLLIYEALQKLDAVIAEIDKRAKSK